MDIKLKPTQEHRKAIFAHIRILWTQWPTLKDTVTDYGFREYIKRVYGIEYLGRDLDTFHYKITDEKLYMWLLLQA